MFKVGNSKLIHQDLGYFNEHYKIKKCMTKAANGVLFHGIRNSDESKVILKIVPKEKCHRFGVMRDRNGLDRVVPIEFSLHFKAR